MDFPRALLNWLTVADYDHAKAEGVRKVMGRYSRGNVQVQAGRYVSDRDAAALTAAGDKAIAQLERAAR